MPFFNEASRIYNTEEVNFLRSCFSNAAILLEESGREYSTSELASHIIMLYEGGLRDRPYIAELGARVAHRKYVSRHPISENAANINQLSADVEQFTLL